MRDSEFMNAADRTRREDEGGQGDARPPWFRQNGLMKPPFIVVQDQRGKGPKGY